jgi:hypothetical protein
MRRLILPFNNMTRKSSDSDLDADSAGFASDGSGFGEGSSVYWCGLIDDGFSGE